MVSVVIGELVEFSSNNGVQVFPAIVHAPPESIRTMLALAFKHVKDPILCDGVNGRGPLADAGRITFVEYLERSSL